MLEFIIILGFTFLCPIFFNNKFFFSNIQKCSIENSQLENLKTERLKDNLPNEDLRNLEKESSLMIFGSKPSRIAIAKVCFYNFSHKLLRIY